MTKTALITGAFQGIGFETARQLGEKGFQVILADVQNCVEKSEESSIFRLKLLSLNNFPTWNLL